MLFFIFCFVFLSIMMLRLGRLLMLWEKKTSLSWGRPEWVAFQMSLDQDFFFLHHVFNYCDLLCKLCDFCIKMSCYLVLFHRRHFPLWMAATSALKVIYSSFTLKGFLVWSSVFCLKNTSRWLTYFSFWILSFLLIYFYCFFYCNYYQHVCKKHLKILSCILWWKVFLFVSEGYFLQIPMFCCKTLHRCSLKVLHSSIILLCLVINWI